MHKTCANLWCNVSFEITDEDLEFYDKISPVVNGKKFPVPPPTLCFSCRRQRKLAFRNERTLYHRTCDLCTKSIVTNHSPENSYPVYCNPCWWSESWDPLTFGRSYDFNRSFFEQYAELYESVPQRAMVNDDGVMSENCAYCFDVAHAKNCYLCIGMWKMQDCLYCRICDQTKFCVDCEGVKLGSELVYESVDSQRLYRCQYLQNSENCTDCIFGFDLKGCQNCIACANLRQKQYCVWNEQKTKEQYENARASLNPGSSASMEKLKGEFQEFIKKFPRKFANMQNCEDCTGDHLFHCRDVKDAFVCTNMQHCRTIERSDGPVWGRDLLQTGMSELCYECITVDDGYMNAFSMFCNQCRSVLYSDNCIASDALLGSISLRRKKYCIFNREYSKEEYEELASKILEHMQRRGEFGEFFPIQLSPFGYNETNAQEFFPLTEDVVRSRNWKWRGELPYTTGKETIQPDALPDDIRDVPDTIVNEILRCSSCSRNYRIIAQETDFYRNLWIPLPRKCPDCRNIERLARRNPQQLWERTCGKCGTHFETTYAPLRPDIVYCEECYLGAVY